MSDRVLPGEPSERAKYTAWDALCDRLDERGCGEACGIRVQDFGPALRAAYAVDGYRLEDVVRLTARWIWEQGAEYSCGDDGAALWVPGDSPPRRRPLAEVATAIRARLERLEVTI